MQRKIPADVREGDTFYNSAGEPVWTALADADTSGRPWTRIAVQYHPDGGRGVREWQISTSAMLTVCARGERPPAVHHNGPLTARPTA